MTVSEFQIWNAYMYYNHMYNIYIICKCAHMSPPCHTGARVVPRGSITWPCFFGSEIE